MDIITGEKFQYLADVYIGEGNVEFNPRTHVYNKTLRTDKCVDVKNIQNNTLLHDGMIIFIYTNVYHKYKDKIINVLSMKKEPFLLIFHNSDDTINESITELFTKTKCKKIFSQNVCVEDKDVHMLPIGIANSKWPHGNLQLLNNVIQNEVNKENKIFFNFTIRTNFEKRNKCYNVIKNKGLLYTKNNNQHTYLTELKKCKFCISPEGNGPDCHRIWECLYLDVIPICTKSIFTEIISKEFPIYIIDDWEQLDINESLFNNYEKMLSTLDKNKLQFSYWKQLIYSYT